MFKRLLAILALLLLSLLYGPVHATDALWQRAVAIAAYNRDMVPGKWSQREEVFNHEGETHLISESVVSFRQVGGTVDVSLVRATNGNQDITLQMREVFEERRAEYSLRPEYNPFLPANQKTITAKPEGRSRREGETLHIAYDYSQRTEGGRWRGLAWIDETSGMPVEVTARLTGLPMKDGKDEIREVVLNVNFEGGADRRWYPKKVVVFKRGTLNNFPYSKFYATMETSITLRDYWQITFQ